MRVYLVDATADLEPADEQLATLLVEASLLLERDRDLEVSSCVTKAIV
jgi:hypothetical protein